MMNWAFVIVTIVGSAWGALAVWFKSPFNGPARALLPVAWLILSAFSLLSVARGWSAAPWIYIGALALMLAWWQMAVRPSNNRQWMPEVSRQTHGYKEGDIVTLNDVRNFTWRSTTDYDARWETRQYALSQVASVDLVLSYWGRPAIAHTMVSFGFSDGQYVVFSVEIRRKLGDRFSEIGGFFRQYELSVLASTEEDSLRVRTNVRGEDGLLFRVAITNTDARALFLAYVETANSLVHKPRFYNTLTANCTTLVYQLAYRIVPGLPMDYRLLLSGYLPEYLHALGGLEGAHSIATYRQGGRFTDRARASVLTGHFSRDIRRGVPGIAELPAGQRETAASTGVQATRMP